MILILTFVIFLVKEVSCFPRLSRPYNELWANNSQTICIRALNGETTRGLTHVIKLQNKTCVCEFILKHFDVNINASLDIDT